MFDLDDPWFRPLWLRIAVVGVCIGWGIFEALGGNSGWAMLFLAAGGYAAWRFFFQNGDGRIVFTIPYEDRYTLIGTTDRDYITFNPGEDE